MIEQRRPKIIIIGSGRSGTSTVSRLCHESLNICMGHELKGPDGLNPKGYYEDIISHGLVRQMTEGVVHIDKYLEIMNRQHTNCISWGVKDPWFLFLSNDWKRILNPRLCIICHRNLEATVESWLKVYKGGGTGAAKQPGRVPNEEVRQGYIKLTQDRHHLCEVSKDIWENHLTINFDTQQDEKSIVERIRAKLL